MRLKVKTTVSDRQHNDYKKDEIGYIDGYLRGADNIPYAVVIINNNIKMISLHCLIVI